ncbi:hypothetical protein [Wolbachia endosymbiont of Drosophila bicornuta]|uniref:hypothetical protein n=1 Tax=Wolbachia endosymbiont of Drosophila bicornuta TaxID=375918 RepID=UPI00380FD74B
MLSFLPEEIACEDFSFLLLRSSLFSDESLSLSSLTCFKSLFIALFTIIRTDHNMLLLYHSHKHISYPIRTIARSAIIVKFRQCRLLFHTQFY